MGSMFWVGVMRQAGISGLVRGDGDGAREQFHEV